MKPPPPPTERDEARIFTDWMDQRGILFWKIPNEQILLSTLPKIRRFKVLSHMKAEGFTTGAHDYIIFSGPRGVRLRGLPGITIELKRIDGTATADQLAWVAILEGLGWQSDIAHGADHAIQILEECFR
ncbi:MAG: hypothetical protein GY926_19490 [bacterium]|nr:hypothetical protein [bacterium]